MRPEPTLSVNLVLQPGSVIRLFGNVLSGWTFALKNLQGVHPKRGNPAYGAGIDSLNVQSDSWPPCSPCFASLTCLRNTT